MGKDRRTVCAELKFEGIKMSFNLDREYDFHKRITFGRRKKLMRFQIILGTYHDFYEYLPISQMMITLNDNLLCS